MGVTEEEWIAVVSATINTQCKQVVWSHSKHAWTSCCYYY